MKNTPEIPNIDSFLGEGFISSETIYQQEDVSSTDDQFECINMIEAEENIAASEIFHTNPLNTEPQQMKDFNQSNPTNFINNESINFLVKKNTELEIIVNQLKTELEKIKKTSFTFATALIQINKQETIDEVKKIYTNPTLAKLTIFREHLKHNAENEMVEKHSTKRQRQN